MGQLVEVIFEDITRSVAEGMVRDVLGTNDGVLEVVADGEPVEQTAGNPVMHPSEAQWVFVRLTAIDLGHGVLVPNVGVRLVQHGALCDVELNADLDDVAEQASFAAALFEFSRRLSANHGVTNYFAALEPAADLDTRLFTGESLGPLRLGPGSR